MARRYEDARIVPVGEMPVCNTAAILNREIEYIAVRVEEDGKE